MAVEQKYSKTRKRSGKIGTTKLEPSEPKSIKKGLETENPIVTWVKKDWAIIAALIIIFFISLFLRSYFYYPVATENGFLLSGNDPFYHKRVIDYAQQYFTHLRSDPLLDYPLIGVNPRPPAYDWSNAVSGLFLSPILNGDVTSLTWYIFLFSPALWGALTIFPIYFLTRDMFGRKPALVAAFFMGIMSSHIERSPLGFSDHDAMVVFFVVTSILFLAKAIGHLKVKYWVSSWRNPLDITTGITDFFKQNPAPIAFSILCGISMAMVALIWKGFPYVFVIIMGSFLILAMINHLRKVDSLGIFLCVYIAFAVSLSISFPYYAWFTTGTWIQPVYMMMTIIVIGIAFVPTRDLPWIIVLPSFIIIIALAVSVLSYFQPETVDALFTGGGYFIKSKLYSTIAEAQAPDTSRLAISYGPVTFYLALIGLVIAAIMIPSHWKMDYFLIIVWCALAIYMAMSAVRFMFNATPVFAILSGWITWEILERLDPTFRAFKKIEIRFIYLYIAILTLLVLSISYWYLYLEHENFVFFQTVTALAMFGIFVSIFTAWVMLKYNFYIGILIYVTYIVIWFWYSFDVLIDQTFKGKDIIWDKIPWEQFIFATLILALVLVPIIIFISYRHRISGSKLDMRHISIALFMVFLVFTPNVMFAIDASIPYEKKAELDPAGKTFGAFGHSFPSEYWQAGMDWLSEQDNEFIMEERPAFISWWDYGFWCLYMGEHPTVADNFQAGYQLAGSFIASTNETQAISLFAVRILEGNFLEKPVNEFSPEIEEIIINHFDDGNSEIHPNYDKIVDLYKIESTLKSDEDREELIKEIESNPSKYGKLSDIKVRNAKYAAVRAIIESRGMEHVVEFLSDLEQETGHNIRYFSVDTRLFPWSAQNTGIFYAPIKLADRDISDYIKYHAMVDVRDNTESEWRSYSDRPVPTEEIADEVDLNDLVDTHGAQNVRITDYQIKYTDDFYNCMFYKCYIGYSYEDLYGEESTEFQEVPGIYGQLASQQPMQGWNMTHFRMVYRTAYWTPHNQTELEELPDQERDWEAMSELEAIIRIQTLEADGVDNDNNGQVDDRGEGGTWSPSYRGGGVFFLKYYHGAIVRGKVVTDTENKTPIQGVRVTVLDDFGIPHDTIFTDEEGNYNLTVPFGAAIIVASKDGYSEAEEEQITQRLRLAEKTTLNTTVHEITDQQAMRQTSNYIIDSDIKIPVGSVKGKIYWELNNNEEFNDNEDEIITAAELYLNGTDKRYNLNYFVDEIDDDGNFKFNEIVPGEYIIFANISGHLIENPMMVAVTSESLDAEQNFGITPGSLWGNATFTNNTEYLPGNISIRLKDLTNNTIMTSRLTPGNKLYSFTNLLPGTYILSVNETGLRYFEDNITFEQGDNQTIEIDLVPVISMSGNLYYGPKQNNFAINTPVPMAHVEFFNNDNSSFCTVMVTNESGWFGGTITNGNYSVYVHYIQGGVDYTHISTINIVKTDPINLNLYLEPGFWINGTLTKQVDTPVPHTKIEFITYNESGGKVNLFIPTNSEGQYRICIPYYEYRIEVYHVSDPGNITYSYYNTSSYLQANIQELIQAQLPPLTGNQTRTHTRASSREINHNIHLDEPSRLWGYLYWDRNGDGLFYTENISIDDQPPLPVPEGEEGFGPVRAPSRSRTRQDDSTNGNDDANDLSQAQEQQYLFESQLSGPEKELVIGAKLVFYHDNGTLETYTDENGYYEVFLPPGFNLITIEDPRFHLLNITNPVYKLFITMPLTKSYQIDGIARNFSVLPINKTITGITWFDINGNGERDEAEIVPNVPIQFIQFTQTGGKQTEITTTSDPITGTFEIALEPGEFFIQVDYNYSSEVKYSSLDNKFVPFTGDVEEPFEIPIHLNKYIFTNISITTEDFALNQSNLKNVSIFFFDNSGLPFSLPLELNGSYYTGFLPPMNNAIWSGYFDPAPEPEESVEESTEGELKGTEYVYFGPFNLSETKNKFNIVMRKAKYLILSAYVDADQSGNFTELEERPQELNLTLNSTLGGTIKAQILDGALNHTIMPGVEYQIIINDTRQQEALHGIKTVQYISEYTFSGISNDSEIEVDVPLVKYIKLMGKIYYDENENGNSDVNELEEGVSINFTGPMDFTVISNETGEFSKFVLLGEYFAAIDNEGFLETPKIPSYNVSLENTFYEIIEIPVRVRLHGITYFDANGDSLYDPEAIHTFGEEEYVDRIIGGTNIEFIKSVLAEPDPATGQLPGTVLEEENIFNLISDPVTGEYEINLLPGEYNVYAYESTGTIYCTINLRIIEHLPEYEYNISLYEGKLVEGNVFYRNTNLNEVHDLYSEETGNMLSFESLDGIGSKQAKYRNGIFDKIYLAYGNYSISTEYISEEFEMDMEYSLQETIEITPETGWLTFEMNKNNDYTFSFTIDGDEVVELQPGDYQEKVFTLVLENEGNVYNLVDLEALNVPAGWIVHLSNHTIPLEISGAHVIERVTVGLTIPTKTFAKNEIQINAAPRGETSAAKSLTLTVKTPAIYGFELGYEDDLDRGIKFNDTLILNLSVLNTGNADDELNFMFTSVPTNWNVSIGEAWKEGTEVKFDEETRVFTHKIAQADIFKNLTIRVISPPVENASVDESITFLVRAWSENRPDIEYSQKIIMSIRKPDLIIRGLKILNADLKKTSNVTIRTTVENKHRYVDNLNFTLYINDVLYQNKSLDMFFEDSVETIEFYWDPTEDVNFTTTDGQTIKFRVVVNGDNMISELDYENNAISIRKFIGARPTEEEFNWRPIFALLTLLIVFLGIYGIYRWRRRI